MKIKDPKKDGPSPINLAVVYLTRHGETARSLSGRHMGLIDLPLTEHGERTVSRLEERLKELKFATVWTSSSN